MSEDQKCTINNVPSLEVIEVWNNPTQRAKIRKKLENNITNHQNRNQNKGLLYIHNVNLQFSQDYKCSIERNLCHSEN